MKLFGARKWFSRLKQNLIENDFDSRFLHLQDYYWTQFEQKMWSRVQIWEIISLFPLLRIFHFLGYNMTFAGNDHLNLFILKKHAICSRKCPRIRFCSWTWPKHKKNWLAVQFTEFHVFLLKKSIWISKVKISKIMRFWKHCCEKRIVNLIGFVVFVLFPIRLFQSCLLIRCYHYDISYRKHALVKYEAALIESFDEWFSVSRGKIWFFDWVDF